MLDGEEIKDTTQSEDSNACLVWPVGLCCPRGSFWSMDSWGRLLPRLGLLEGEQFSCLLWRSC